MEAAAHHAKCAQPAGRHVKIRWYSKSKRKDLAWQMSLSYEGIKRYIIALRTKVEV